MTLSNLGLGRALGQLRLESNDVQLVPVSLFSQQWDSMVISCLKLIYDHSHTYWTVYQILWYTRENDRFLINIDWLIGSKEITHLMILNKLFRVDL